MATEEYIKENVWSRRALATRWLCAAAAATALALPAVALIDHALPAPRTRRDAPSDRFIAEIAYEHLLNLTSIGPRVAGSYENEVAAVGALVARVRDVTRTAAPHHRLELDVQRASGAFPLAFLDGMNNVYRDVQSVVVRLSAAGGRPRARPALLLNCHFDTVPDSPGASDDGAGCAVVLESMRALAASRAPLRHDVIFLLNGAEENILQASHGFITQHRWARSVRAFINIEACGAGGREVLFQAGPHDPWIVEQYAAVVPHPFASSLAQEVFESGLIPADTDFRIFRDFGNLSGVDLAWSANGYVYHTALDTAERVPLAALQRTGDNVLALAHGLLASERLDSEPDRTSRQPVFFDVLGLVVMSARAPLAAAVALAAGALVALKIHLNATDAGRHLYMRRHAWWGAVVRTLGAWAVAHAAGVLASAAVALGLHAVGARLTFFSRPWLLAPLYALPALAATWATALRLGARSTLPARGWWRARAWGDAAALAAAGALLACCARGVRSGFVPLAWALLPAAADLPREPRLWPLGAALPVLQTWYLALGALRMLVPVMGRAGVGPVPSDVIMATLVSTQTLAAFSWLLPLVIAARKPQRLVYWCGAAAAAACVLAAATPLGAPYSAERPQRYMVFHARRTRHDLRARPAPVAAADAVYWVPDLDANSPRAVAAHVAELRAARPVSAAECAAELYCGAPYYLPVLSLIGASHAAPAPAAPLPRLRADLALEPLNGTVQVLTVRATGPAHVVAVVAPAEGARVSWSSAVERPLEAPAWGRRRVYFFALHAARGADVEPWTLRLHIEHEFASPPERWADVSLAGHSLFGERKLHPAHRRLLESFPPWTTTTGWGVDLHLYVV